MVAALERTIFARADPASVWEQHARVVDQVHTYASGPPPSFSPTPPATCWRSRGRARRRASRRRPRW
jgi:hypothetical protein